MRWNAKRNASDIEESGESAGKTTETPPQKDESPEFLDSREHFRHGHLPALPERLEQAISSLPKRHNVNETGRVILLLCAWRPLRAIELAAYLQYKGPHYLRDKFLTPLIESGMLGITTDSIHSPHLQYKTERAGLDLLKQPGDVKVFPKRPDR